MILIAPVVSQTSDGPFPSVSSKIHSFTFSSELQMMPSAPNSKLSRTYEWESEPASETMDITVRIDKAIPTIDLTLDFEVDNTLIAAYNEANGTDYEAAPEGLVTVGADPVIKAGDGYTLLPVTINTNAIAVDTEVEVNGVTETKKLIKRE